LTRLLSSLPGKNTLSIERITEFVGRERRHRYFVADPSFQIPNQIIERTSNRNISESLQNFEMFSSSSSIDIPDSATTTIETDIATENVQKLIDKPATPNSPSVTKNVIKSGTRDVSITAEQRANDFLMLLEKKKILESGSDLSKEFGLLEEERNPELSRFTMDKRTILRTATKLEQAGKLTIVKLNIPRMTGTPMTKTLFLHPSLNKESPEVLKFIENIKDRVYFIGTAPAKPMANPIAHGITVERFSTTGIKIDPSQKESQIMGLAIAQQYGWINAKMIRAKLLHQFIWTYIHTSPSTTMPFVSGESFIDYNKNGGIFPTKILFRQIPFSLYLKIIGLTTIRPEIDNFIKIPNVKNMTIENLPEYIRTIIFSSSGRFRRSLKQLIDILLQLQILAIPSTTVDTGAANISALSDVMSPSYKLEKRVHLRNYSSPDAPIIETKDLTDMTDVVMFWMRLQYTSISDADDQWQNEIEDDFADDSVILNTSRTARKMLKTGSDNPFAYICNLRNWTDVYPLSASQRSILESYVDRISRTTPLNDELVCQTIASKALIPVARVKFFYKKLEAEFERKFKFTRRSNFGMSRSAAKDAAILVGQDRIKATKSLRSSARLREKDEASAIPGDEKKNGEEVEEKLDFTLRPSRKRHQPPTTWFTKEDETLLYAYVIARDSLDIGGDQLWECISNVVPRRKEANYAQTIKRRIESLARRTYVLDSISTLTNEWNKVKHEFLEEHDLLPSTNIPKDLLSEATVWLQNKTQINNRYP